MGETSGRERKEEQREEENWVREEKIGERRGGGDKTGLEHLMLNTFVFNWQKMGGGEAESAKQK